MLEDPGLDRATLTSALRDAYGIEATGLTFMPSYDARAASYEVSGHDGRHFLKVRFDALDEARLTVPAALRDAGVSHVLAPIRTRTGELWCRMDERSLVVYPFVPGRTAMAAGMSESQWRAFGTALRAVHDSGLERRFANELPTDRFGLPAAVSVRRMLEVARTTTAGSASAGRFAAFLRDNAARINSMLDRADSLRRMLQGRRFDRVLCHADIHAANILVAGGGDILLVDWDGPMLAPRERDLLFVIGSRIARTVEPREEAWFFDGYGSVEVDREAIAYYRYERVLEDIGEFAASILFDDDQDEATRSGQADLVASFFEPGGMVETAEQVEPMLPDR